MTIRGCPYPTADAWCPRDFSTWAEMSAHLVNAHLYAASTAIAVAKNVFDGPEAAVMEPVLLRSGPHHVMLNPRYVEVAPPAPVLVNGSTTEPIVAHGGRFQKGSPGGPGRPAGLKDSGGRK